MKAFVRYSNSGVIIAGTLIKVKVKPSGTGWFEVPYTLCCSGDLPVPQNTGKAAYVKYDGKGIVVGSSTIVRKTKPNSGKWLEIPYQQCCNPSNQS